MAWFDSHLILWFHSVLTDSIKWGHPLRRRRPPRQLLLRHSRLSSSSNGTRGRGDMPFSKKWCPLLVVRGQIRRKEITMLLGVGVEVELEWEERRGDYRPPRRRRCSGRKDRR